MMASSSNTLTIERRSAENANSHEKHYYDPDTDLTVVKLFTGDYFVTDRPKHMLVTILGSCVSACIRDPMSGIGGMNHFLLPECRDTDNICISNATRYGANAMETLINKILLLGGSRQRLEVKLFGGGNITSGSTLIGTQNINFVRRYMREEGIPINSEDMGGDYPRRIHYYPDTGKVMMRNLRRKDDFKVIEEEKVFADELKRKAFEGKVDMF